jgi:hypothetical protein
MLDLLELPFPEVAGNENITGKEFYTEFMEMS